MLFAKLMLEDTFTSYITQPRRFSFRVFPLSAQDINKPKMLSMANFINFERQTFGLELR